VLLVDGVEDGEGIAVEEGNAVGGEDGSKWGVGSGECRVTSGQEKGFGAFLEDEAVEGISWWIVES